MSVLIGTYLRRICCTLIGLSVTQNLYIPVLGKLGCSLMYTNRCILLFHFRYIYRYWDTSRLRLVQCTFSTDHYSDDLLHSRFKTERYSFSGHVSYRANDKRGNEGAGTTSRCIFRDLGSYGGGIAIYEEKQKGPLSMLSTGLSLSIVASGLH